jgi:hypothetical protein
MERKRNAGPGRPGRLDKIRAKIAGSVNDRRPSLPAKEVRTRLKKLHQKTVKARRHGA